MTDTHNPGSPEAVAKGCRCPVLDNNHGQGLGWHPVTGTAFWINEECPLHAGGKHEGDA